MGTYFTLKIKEIKENGKPEQKNLQDPSDFKAIHV